MGKAKECNITDNETIRLFFALIRCGIDKDDRLPATPSKEQWDELFDIACKQTLQGIAYAGIEKLPKEQRPDSELLIKWYHITLNIKKKNKELTRASIKVSEKFEKEGFRNCILKGQGIAQYYPDPELRMPGDIDIWLEGGCDKVIEYVKSIIPDSKPTYHHVDFNVINGIDIEVHYRPTWMYNPFNNRCLQRFFAKRSDTEFIHTTKTNEGMLHIPTATFNMVFIPVHIFRHLFTEGIGMRQILDYYFVMQQKEWQSERATCINALWKAGVLRFTKALMYVMQQMFALDEEQMIVDPDEKCGKMLMREILLAGNFGKQDARFERTRGGYNLPHLRNQLKRSGMLMKYYSSDTFWGPLFKIWHAFWRRRHKSKQSTNGNNTNEVQ